MARKKNKHKPSQTPETIAKPPKPDFPELGHQLIVSHPKPIQGVPKSEGWIRIAPKWSQRFRRFIITFAEGFIFAFIALIPIYLTDFIADYSHREEGFIRFFFGFILSALLFIGLFAAILTLIRDNVCYIHPKNGRIFYGSRFNLNKIEESIEISSIGVLELIPPESFLRRSKILTTHLNTEITIVETHGDDKDINDLYYWLKSWK